ncbi:MAG: Flp pilus assembly protein CpaB [Chloroflexota bacterium]|nr:Flp pilus assembly protein CpaB [Chloroflexota bacterium]
MQTTLKPPKLSKNGGGPLSTKNGGGPLSSKNGSILAAVATAALAGLIIMVFLNQYRNKVNEDGVPTPVLVAQQLIEQGASADSVGAQGLFKSTTVPRDQLKKGAVTDAARLRGKIAVADILPGQQLTATDFKPAGGGIVTKLAADQRAISVSLDSAHGLVGNIKVGDHVDVLSGFMLDSSVGRQRPVLRMLMQDVLVLAVPPKPAGPAAVGAGANQTSQVTLRVPANATPKIAFAADNGKLWLVLRPQNGAKLERTTLVSLASLLVDGQPVKLPGGRAR